MALLFDVSVSSLGFRSPVEWGDMKKISFSLVFATGLSCLSAEIYDG